VDSEELFYNDRGHKMAKRFTYTNTKTGRIIFESVEPNYVSITDVDLKVKEKTGKDPRLNPHLIERQIRIVSEPERNRV